MWQQLFGHSWKHILSEARILWWFYGTPGGIAENNKLDFFPGTWACTDSIHLNRTSSWLEI